MVVGFTSIGHLMELVSSELCYLLLCFIFCHCCEVGIDHGVRVFLSALHNKSAVEESSVNEHLPNDRTTPVVRIGRRVNCQSIIIMSSFQNLRDSKALIQINTNQILS